MELEFYLDDSGLPSARGEDERLATYLQTDLQGSVALTEELIRLLNDPDFTGDLNGNAHCVDFRENSISIEAVHDADAPDRVLSREAMLEYAQAWLAFLQTNDP